MHRDPMHRWKLAGLIALGVIVLSVPLHAIKENRSRAARLAADGSVATFVGREACIDCHEEADQAWLGSDHDRATAPASDSTVLGDFADAVFEHGDIRARFYTRDDKYFVHTQGPDGEPAEFEITYTIGFEPVQQYLVPFPGGRLQALSIAWDTERGRWYYLFPGDDISPGDWRHWTRGGQTWNGQCAECHSTNVVKGYDPETQTFSTTWSEIDVSCETCHGPGSRHVAWAEVPTMARVASDNYELVINTSDMNSRQEVDLCAPCHSRRMELGDYDHRHIELLESFVPSLLTEGLYFADGQILGEVYDYGSYQQSKMYQEGVRCGDCHDVHSLELIESDNDLCLGCHRASTYDDYDHHFHQRTYRGEPSDGALCVKCHMPERPYMLIDYRADHGIGVPRPDLTLAIGVPNACNASGCHDDRSARWSADHFLRWYGESTTPHYGSVLAAAREGAPEAEAELIATAGDTLYAPIVRATALALLRSYPGEASTAAYKDALADDEALVRYTAADNVSGLDAEERVELLAPLLFDPAKAVRLAAATRLAGIPAGLLQDYQREGLDEALREFQQAMEYALDFPFAGFNLGNLYMSLRDTAGAEPYYRTAIDLDDSFYPAKLNLAGLLNSRGQNEEAENLLREILRDFPEVNEAAYPLAMILAETGRYEEAAVYLRQASAAMPEESRILYNLGLIEQAKGRTAEAEDALLRALEAEPGNLDYLYALADHYVTRGELVAALEIAERMIASDPDSEVGPQVKIFVEAALQQGSR
jgi:tetratricopeptide (TPR) repeat protein